MVDVLVGLSVSIDGFITGPNDGVDNPLGDGGGRLFQWMSAGGEELRINRWLAPPETSRRVVDEWQGTGAIVVGRKTFDIARGWANGHPIDVPIFVVTHHEPEDGGWSKQVRFVKAGFEDALDRAIAAAGDGFVSLGSADVTQQALRAGRLDIIDVNLVPCLLGGGVRLFDNFDGPIDLVQERVIQSDGVTHLRYRVTR